MKRLITCGLTVLLGFCAARTWAEDAAWRAAPASSTSSVTLSRPVPALGSAVPVSPAPMADGSVAFRPSLGQPMPVFRGKVDDDTKPLPLGPALKGETSKEPATIKEGQPKFEQVKPMPAPLSHDFVPAMPHMAMPHMAMPHMATPYMAAPHMMAPMPSTVSPSPIYGSFYGGDCCDPCNACSAPVSSRWDCCDMGCAAAPCSDCFSCGDTGCCPERGRMWANASYLLWAFKQKNVPPLATVSPPNTPAGVGGTSGVLGLPTTIVAIDEDDQESAWHSGGRFNIGFWFPRREWLGLEAGFFFLGQNDRSVSVGSTGAFNVHRPFIFLDPATGNTQEGVQDVAVAGRLTGTITVDFFSKLWGLEMNLRRKLCCNDTDWVDLILGYRMVNLEEGITITENLNRTIAPAGPIFIQDNFRTRNVFHGAQVGIQGERNLLGSRWFAGYSLKVAVGNMHQTVNISGFSSDGTQVPTRNFNSGALAALSNIGRQQSDRFAVVPEVNLKFGYELNENWRVWVGYDFLYMSNVVRPGDQIDRTVNPTFSPILNAGLAQPQGTPRPAVLFKTTDFWAQGVNFGMEYRW